MKRWLQVLVVCVLALSVAALAFWGQRDQTKVSADSAGASPPVIEQGKWFSQECCSYLSSLVGKDKRHVLEWLGQPVEQSVQEDGGTRWRFSHGGVILVWVDSGGVVASVHYEAGY